MSRRDDALPLVVVVTLLLHVASSSDFYYDNWQCNNYLSAASVVVEAGAGHLREIHVRDDIPVSSQPTFRRRNLAATFVKI